MNALSAFIRGYTNIGLADPNTFYISMICRQDYIEAPIKENVEQPPQRPSFGPVVDARMHAVSSHDAAMQHLVDRTDNDSGDPTARWIDLFLDAPDKGIVVFQGSLARIDGIALTETAIFPEAHPMLFFLPGRIQARSEEERWVTGKNRLARDGRQGWDPREQTELFGDPLP